MSTGLRLFANLGAEEAESWRRMSRHPRLRSVARLWAALFPAGARLLGGADPLDAPRLAGRLARDAGSPALRFCVLAEPALVPWLSTPEAETLARSEGVAFAASPSGVVRRVHDKAFAHEAALRLGLVPEALRGAALVLGPEELADPDTARCRIEDALARWPAPLAERFALKPRLGTSGRGRLSGVSGRIDPARLEGALERLRAAGGALVEPWLERTQDLSAQMLVRGPDEIELLGTLRSVLTRTGQPCGHAGRLGLSGEVAAGTRFDEALRSAAVALAREAGRAGFRGPCGVDALVFRAVDGAEVLRPIVELNARYTMGTVALGLAARALRAGLARGARFFYLGFPPAAGEWPAEPGAGLERFEILVDDPSARVLFARDERALAETVFPDRRTP